jgi:hypothetical protein
VKQKIPQDLDVPTSGENSLARIMGALVATGSHFTDSMTVGRAGGLSVPCGRGVALLLRVHVHADRLDELRGLLGDGCELKDPPRLDICAPSPEVGT